MIILLFGDLLGMASDLLPTARRSSAAASLAAASLYAGVSIVMVLSNKALLSTWAFDFTASLLLLQNALTLALLSMLRAACRAPSSSELQVALAFPLWDRAISIRSAPLALAYLLNVGCGLAALRLASVPVYQVLKRLAPLPAMALDSVLRGAVFSRSVRAAILLVAGGAVLTGIGDAELSELRTQMRLAY